MLKNAFLYDNFVFARYKFKNSHYNDNRKGSPFNYLGLLLKGNAELVTKDKTITISEGEVFYIPKNLSYQSYWQGEEIEFLSFGFSVLHTKDKLQFNPQVVPCKEELSEQIKSIPTKMHNIDCNALSLFYAVMEKIIPKLKESCDNNEQMKARKIKACIKANPFCSMSEVARLCGVSEPHLYYVFKKYENMTPNDYRQELLCRIGIDLLLTTDKKIEEISRIINFSSGSYFRKVLKKHTGFTPREIRKKRSL